MFLAKFYSIMVKIKDHPEEKLWARLSESEREELLKAEFESNNPENFIPHRELKISTLNVLISTKKYTGISLEKYTTLMQN